MNRIPIRYAFCDAPFHYQVQCEHHLRACSRDPGVTHPILGQLSLGAWPGVCYCSNEFFVVPGQLQEGFTRCTTPVTRLVEVTFLHVNRLTQQLPRAKVALRMLIIVWNKFHNTANLAVSQTGVKWQFSNFELPITRSAFNLRGPNFVWP